MKQIRMMIIAVLAMLMPTMLFGGGKSSTYYSALKTQMSSKSTGMGKVYAGTSQTAPATSNYQETSSQSSNQSSSTKDAAKTFYAFATENEGYEFVGWSTSENGTTTSSDNPYAVSVKCSSTSSGSPTLTTVYANFKKKVLAAFSIIFETSSAGTYTVDGATPANKTGLTEATSVVLKSTDANFLNWLVNGTVVNNNPYTATCLTDTTISAEFLTADQVTSVTTLADLTAALSNAAYKKIIIPSGTSLTVAKGSTVTVPSGKRLVVDGTLSVIGALSNNGVISGSGFVLKVTKMISQGEVKIPANAYTTYPDHAYQETTVSANSPAITGNSISSEMLKWGVQLNGGEIYRVNTEPGIIYCSLDTSIAQNHIKAITSASATFSSPGSAGTSMCVLTANTSMDSTTSASLSDKSGYLNFQGKLDTAGYKLTISREARSNFSIWVYNGTYQMTTSTNPQVRLTNCSYFKATSMNAGGSSVLIELYDCGPTFQIGFSKTSSSASPKMVKFYSGTYDSSNSDINYQVFYAVYGGTFKNEPTSSCLDTGLIAKPEASANNYYVVKPNVTEYVAAIGAEQYESLSEAVSMATAGANIKILKNVSLTQSLSIEQGKNVTIDLLGFDISGASIVNDGMLNIVDSSAADTKGEVSSAIVNRGTMGIAYGTYSGSITLSGGTFTTHNGLFLGTITVDGGVADLRGGRFASSVSSLLREGFVETSYAAAEDDNSSYYWVGTNVVAVVTADNPIADADKSFSARAITPEEMTYLIDYYSNGKTTRTTCDSDAKWFRLAEVLSAVRPWIGNVIDVAVLSDRVVNANTVTAYGGAAGSSQPFVINKVLNPGDTEAGRVFSPQIASSGQATAQISYDRVFTAKDPWHTLQNVTFGITNGSDDNKGTLCAIQLQLCSSSKLTITGTRHILSSTRVVLGAGTNAAMIRPATGAATFYSTLVAAMDAAADGGTVMLANDCDTALPLNKAGTYTFDTMGFAASDAVSVGDGLFVKSETSVDSSAKVLVPDAKAMTYVVAQKVASVGGTFYDNLTEAVGAANGATVTLLAATDETITLGEGQTLSLNKNGIAFDDAKVVTSVDGSSVKATTSEGVTVYSLVKDVVTSGEAHYPSIEAAIEAAEGNTVAVTVVAADTETIDLDAGKTLVVTVADGVTANVTVDPGEGAFIDATTDGNTTTYESKKITVEMATPQATVEVKKIDNGTESAVTDTTEINAAVTQLMGNHDVPRTDNTDKLDVLDKITVTPTKIVEEVVESKTIIRSATFDVTPAYNAGQSLGEGQKLKFRLPVDAAATQLSAIVYHGTAQFGIFAVQTYNAEKFIEVESDAFSPYGYELLDGETTNPIAAIGTTGYATLPGAIAAASNGDTITVFAGTFDIGSDTIVVNKQVTITGAGKDTTTLNSTATGKAAFSIQASNVTIENMTINQADTTTDNTLHVAIAYTGSSASPTVAYSDVTLQNLKFTGSKYSVSVYAEDLTIDSCDFVNPASDAILLYCVKGDSKITNNTFSQSSAKGQGFIYGTTASGNDYSSGTLTISGNTASGGRCFYHCNNQNYIDTTTKLTLTITDNEVIGYNNKAIVFAGHSDIPLGTVFNSVTVTNNAIYTSAARPAIQRDDTDRTTLTIDASGNYWGAATPDFENLIPGTSDKYLIMPHDASNIAVESWYQAYDEDTDTLSNLYTVPRVAQNTTTGVQYESLAAAVAAASAGDTITMLADDDVSLTSGGELVINKSLTISGPVDGEGKPLYTIYGTEDATDENRILVDGSGTVTLSNLNIAGFGNDHATDASHAAVYVASTFTGTVNLDNLNISDFNRGGVFLYGGTFNVTDCTIDCANDRTGAFTKGIEIRNNASGTIADSTIVNMTSESEESVAGGIEFYGNGAVTVSGCTIEGDSMGAIGIGTAGFTDTTTTGTITVEDCDITVYYAALYASALGDGLGENGTTIKVTGGDYTADNFAISALYGAVEIEDGTFNGMLEVGDEDLGESGSLSISGGVFEDDVLEAYCADGYIPTVDEDTGLNTVKQGTYVAAIYDDNDDLVGKYETLADAFADASEGDTVLLLTDVAEAIAYGENISVTLNLNGKTISVSSGCAISVTAGELTVTSVVDDDGYATGGIVGAISVSDGASLKLTGGIYDVDWDECDIEGSIAVSSVNRFYDWDPTEVEAASAVFTSPVPYEYCATGFIPGAYDDIYIDGGYYYYVKEGTFLWKITDADGKVAYSETVPDAEEDEEWWEYDWFGEHEMNRNGFTMTLLHDVSADDDNFSAYVSGLTYTVDLGGHTVNQQMGFGVGECDVTIVNGTVSNAGGTAISIANGAQVTLGNGLVIAQSTTGVYVEGGTEEGACSKLTVKNGAAINGTYGVLVFGSGSSNPVTEVVVEGGTITGTTYGISGNGTIEGDTDYSNTRITVSGGTVSGGEVGIYHPQAGELSVSGGTISGKMAIYARSGTIAVTGGSLNATGTGGEYNVSYAGNELQATGDALVLDAVDYPGGNPTASISGGMFTSLHGDGVASYAATGQTAQSGFVSGGTFSLGVPEEYCADGYIPTDADPVTGLYTVKQGAYVAQIGETKYDSLEAAFAAANEAGTATIKMLEDVDVTNVAYAVSAGNTITLDLNGKTVKGTDNTNGNFAFITNKGTFTIDDTSENHDGELVYGSQTPNMNPVPGYGNYTIENEGTLTIVAGTVRQTTRGPACYAVNNSSRSSDAVLNMQGGLMTSPGNAIRAYGLSDTYENVVNVSGGSIAATGAGALMVQLGSSAPKVTLNVTGGSMSGRDYAFFDLDYGNSLENVTYNIQAGTFTGEIFTYGATTEISGGTFNGPVTEKAGSLTISGGTFNNTVEAYGGGTVQISNGTFNGTVVADDNGTALISGGQFASRVRDDYCVPGYIPTAQDPDTGMYTVTEGTYVAQIVRNDEVIAKYETFAAALEDAQSGDTVQLLADVEDVTETFVLHGKNITIDGQGLYSITAGENTEPRSVVQSYGGARNMFVVQSGNVTFKDITLDGGETHYYTFLVQAKSGTTTFDNVSLLHGGEADSSGTAGVGYGAAVQVDGATVLVTNSFYACTGTNVNDVTTGVFPFTALLYQSGGIHFADGVTAGIGDDLLLVGMVGAVDVSTDAGREMVSEMLEAMNVPAGYYPYTLKLGDSEMTSFTGASPLGWNGIIDYGSDIMVAANTSMGMDLNPDTTPVEVGLLADTVLPETFIYEDGNLTVNGNGNALSGTIKYTDDAGTLENVVLGSEGNQLVLDMTGLSTGNSINLGTSIAASNVTIKVTEEQATTLGQAIVTWNTEGESEEAEASLETGIKVVVVNAAGEPVEDPVTGDPMEASIIWDAEMGVAYIGPCEARLTGPTHESPIYTSLASAIARAADTGDTITLLTNVVNRTDTYEISKQDLVIDGAGYTVAAAPVTEHRNMFEAWGGSKNMFKLQTGNITFRNITLDGDETHAYTFLISADNSSVALTTENVRLIHGGEISVDSDNATVTPGNGYGAAIHLNNGAHLIVSNGFYACTGTNVNGVTTGVFPFTAILPENLEAGTSVAFELTGDSNDPANVDIGDDLLLVGMIGDLIDQYGIATVQGILDYMKVPSRFIPYTLTLADGSDYAFTGASPRRWNEIIDYGKDIMDVATANGFSGLNKETTPVEVGLATDTVLPAGNADDGYDFLYEDSNFSINGNGNALSGTIKFTDDAKGGLMHDIDLGTDDAPLTLDLSVTTNAVMLGGDVIISNVVVKLTEDQATLGRVVFEWDSGETPPDDEQGVEVTVVDNSGTPTGETKGLIWDEEYGIAFIGPVEARLTGPTHEVPIYTTLADAIARAAASGDKVTLMTNVTLSACQTIDKSIEFSLNGQALAASGDAISVASGAAVQMFSEGTVTGNIAVVSGTLTITNGIYVGGLSKADGDGAKFVISGGYFRDPVLQEYCADGYSPVKTTASKYAATPYTVARVEIVYPTGKTDGGLDTVGVPIPLAWINSNTDLVGEDGLVLEELDQIVTDLGDTGANGVPLWQSYVLGLDPNSATSQLRLEGLPATSDEKVTIRGLNINVPAILESQGTTVGFHLEEAAPGSDSWTVRDDACTMAEGLPTFTVPLSTVDGKVLRIVADIKTRSK